MSFIDPEQSEYINDASVNISTWAANIGETSLYCLNII